MQEEITGEEWLTLEEWTKLERRVFSPSQTETWSFCPVKRVLAYQEKWRPRQLGKRELAAILGRAFGAGVGTYFQMVKAGGRRGVNATVTPSFLSVASEAASVVAVQARRDLEALGATVGEWDLSQADATPRRAADAVTKFIEWDLNGRGLPHQWEILDVERTLVDHGRARIDLGVHDGSSPAVVDWKVKLTLKDQYRQKEIERYRFAGQMLHYDWAYGETLGLPPLPRHYIGLVVLEPRFSFELIPYDVGPEDHAKWLASARRAWELMEEDDTMKDDTFYKSPLRMSWTHADNFGPCEYTKACFDYHWDPEMMARDYVQIGGKDGS